MIKETTPLLSADRSAVKCRDESLESIVSPDPSLRAPRVLIVVCIVFLLSDIANFLNLPPQTVIFEDIICKDYYTRNPSAGASLLHEERCKVEAVQSQLAILQGYQETFEQLPGIVFGIAYGLLADRIGRRPVLLLCLLGSLLAGLWVKAVCWWPHIFPIEMVWLSSPIQIIGGGGQVVSSILFVMVADSSSKEKRTAAFAYLTATCLPAEIVATPISGAIMLKNPWVPFLLSSGVDLLVLVIAMMIIPETLRKGQKYELSSLSDEHLTKGDVDHAPFSQLLMSRARDQMKEFQEATRFVWKNVNITLIMVVFFVATLSRQSLPFLLQYAAKKYHWNYSEASLLITFRGGVNLATILVVLPYVSWLLMEKGHFDAFGKDLWLSRVTALFLTLGTLIMAFAPTPEVLVFGIMLFALGTPLHLTARSLITSLVRPEQIGVLYTSLGTAQSFGMLVAGPMLANTFRWGMKLGDAWLGLPFLVASSLYFVSLLSIMCVRHSEEEKHTIVLAVDSTDSEDHRGGGYRLSGS